MGPQHMHNQELGLVLSTVHAKPRLKWTPQLHHRFIEAVDRLGGADKATPKGLMRMMGIPGLTLYHLKSHLQKYRLRKHLHSESCGDSTHNAGEYKDDMNNLTATQDGTKKNIRVTQPVQMQIEVQRKLHEQIEMERQLQLRIEAQGKYLGKVLKRAEEILDSSSSTEAIQHTKCELYESLSEPAEAPDSYLLKKQRLRGEACSPESSLTSSESSGNEEIVKFSQDITPCTLSETRVLGQRKRVGSTVFDGDCLEQRSRKKFESFDLNRECDQNSRDLDLGTD